MELLLRRKTALFCLLLVYSAFFAPYWSAVLRSIFMCICAGAAFVLSLPVCKKRRHGLCAAGKSTFLGILSGLILFSLYTDLYVDRIVEKYSGATASVTAVIREKVYSYSYAAAYAADVRTADGEAVSFSVLLQSGDVSLERGDVIKCTASLHEFPEYSGAFPERKYYLSRGIPLSAEAENTVRTGEERPGIRGLFAEMQENFSAILFVELGRDGAALPSALLLGDRSLLPDTLLRDFSRLGISHMLAISGFHFAVLLGMLSRLLRPVVPSRKARMLILMGAAVFYMLLCGMSESIVRAGLMYLAACAAQLLGRKSDMLTALGVCAALMLIIHPSSLYSVSFQLSVSAVIGIGIWDHARQILYTDKPVGRLRRIGREAVAFFGMSTVIQLFLMPLLCLYFGEMSLLTPVASLLFTPLIQLILTLSPLILLFRGPVFLSGFLVSVCESVSSLASRLAQPQGITVSLHYAFAPFFAAGFAVLLLLSVFQKSKRRILGAFLGCLVLIIGYGGGVALTEYIRGDDVRVISTAYSKNDALIVQWRTSTLLCDVSDGSYTALSTAYAAARESAAVELDALLLTHLHNRHIQSFDRLSDAAYVRALILPKPCTESEESIVQALQKIAQEKSIPVYLYDSAAGDTVQFGDAQFLMEEREWLSRSTHPVICFRLEARGKSLLYLSSSWNETDAAESLSGADAVIFGAHGPVYKKPSDCLWAGTAILRGESESYIHVPLRTRAPVGTEESSILLFREEDDG